METRLFHGDLSATSGENKRGGSQALLFHDTFNDLALIYLHIFTLYRTHQTLNANFVILVQKAAVAGKHDDWGLAQQINLSCCRQTEHINVVD